MIVGVCPTRTCIGSPETVVHREETPFGSPAVVSQGTQLPEAPANVQISAFEGKSAEIDNGEQAVERVPQHSQPHSIDEVRHELLSLSLQHADVLKRIRCLRNALVALVNVFGPYAIASQRHAHREQGFTATDVQPAVVSLCREVLKNSQGWLTIREILDAVRERSPVVLANFKNPGVSVSNVLRRLRRQREVELELDVAGTRWRWAERESNASF